MTAPINATGGIATWARIVTDNAAAVRWEIIDSSRVRLMGAPKGWRGRLTETRQDLARVARMICGLATARYDLLYLNCAPFGGFLLRDLPMAAIARAFGVPAVIHLHGGSVSGFFGSGLRLRATLALVDRVSLAIVITPDVFAFLKASLPTLNVQELPNPVPDALVSGQASRDADSAVRKQLLHVGWQGPGKGTFVAIEALSDLPDGYELTLVGQLDDAMRGRIVERAAELGVSDRVTLTGNLSHEDVTRWMAGSGVLLLPSRDTEGFPMVVAEAMAGGLPVVGAAVGAVESMLGCQGPDPAGVVVPATGDPLRPADPAAVAAAVLEVTDDADRWIQMSRAGQRRALHLRAGLLVPELEQLLVGLVDEHATRHVVA